MVSLTFKGLATRYFILKKIDSEHLATYSLATEITISLPAKYLMCDFFNAYEPVYINMSLKLYSFEIKVNPIIHSIEVEELSNSESIIQLQKNSQRHKGSSL